jgi:hypothetical protein
MEGKEQIHIPVETGRLGIGRAEHWPLLAGLAPAAAAQGEWRQLAQAARATRGLVWAGKFVGCISLSLGLGCTSRSTKTFTRRCEAAHLMQGKLTL